ncbi:MAG: LacI family DNA-binding transcriptional regulator [Anaerolineae bacterium]
MAAPNRVTMTEIAEKSGVSLATVSLVLRDKPGVGAETRERVMQVARDLGYFPKNANGLPALPITNVGVILKEEPHLIPQANRFYSHVVAGIEVACRRRNLNLFYATMTVDANSYPLELPRILLEENTAEGFLLLGAFLSEPLRQVVARHSVPMILVDAYAVEDVYDAVVSDNVKGAYEAVTYLIRRGHRHIAFVGSHPDASYPSIRERQCGYRQALADAQIAESYCANCHIIDTAEIAQATTALIEAHPHITAIFAANDETAITVMETLRSLGRQIPDDISVVGYDDIDLASRVSPRLTTMQVDKAEMGRMAVQLLINRVQYPESGLVRVMLPPRLLERDSVRTIQA